MPLQPLRTLLLSPREFFAARPYDLGPAVVLVLVVALVTTAAFTAVGWLLAESVDGTNAADTGWTAGDCERFADMDVSTPTACASDDPSTRWVDAGGKVWSVWTGLVSVVFAGSVVGWLLIAAGLHVASAAIGGRGSFGRTATVAAWGMIPGLPQTLVAFGALGLAISGVDFASDPETLERQVQRLADTGSRPVVLAAMLAGTAWQGYVWAGGLVDARELDWPEALFAAAVVALAVLLFSVT